MRGYKKFWAGAAAMALLAGALGVLLLYADGAVAVPALAQLLQPTALPVPVAGLDGAAPVVVFAGRRLLGRRLRGRLCNIAAVSVVGACPPRQFGRTLWGGQSLWLVWMPRIWSRRSTGN